MSILIDNAEPEEFSWLLNQMGIETQRGAYNQQPNGSTEAIYSDFTIVGKPKTITVSRKQATEILGDIDKVEDQLHRELQSKAVDNILLMVEGLICWHPDGVAGFSVEPEKIVHEKGRYGNEYDSLKITGRVFHQPYQRWIAFVDKLWDIGIPVVSTGEIRGSAVFLSRLHEGKENNIFTRLIKQTYVLSEWDISRSNSMKSYMGLSESKIGQELAGVYADTGMRVGQMALFLADGGSVSELKLPSGRRVGLAAEKNLRTALGIGERT